MYNFSSSNSLFKNNDQRKIVFRHTEAERIHNHQKCIQISIKESPSSTKKMNIWINKRQSIKKVSSFWSPVQYAYFFLLKFLLTWISSPLLATNTSLYIQRIFPPNQFFSSLFSQSYLKVQLQSFVVVTVVFQQDVLSPFDFP